MYDVLYGRKFYFSVVVYKTAN